MTGDDPMVDVVVARLDDAGLEGGAHDTNPPAATYPHVIVYADSAPRSSDREADVRVRRTLGWQTTVVGRSVGQCRAALGRVTALLEDWTPDLDGAVCSKVEHEGTQPVRADTSLPDPVLFIATDQWSYVADPTV